MSEVRTEGSSEEPEQERNFPASAHDLGAEMEHLRDLNERLERFAAATTHELSEPLRVIAGYALLLVEGSAGPITPQQDDYLARIARSVDRMQRLLDDLHHRGRGGAPSFSTVDLAVVIQDVLEDLGVAIAEREASVRLATQMPQVWADRVQVAELLTNLIANAIKYGPPLGGEVTLSAQDVGDGWQVSVADRGIGIDPVDFDRIFLPFTRVRVEGLARGSGLGLSICSDIVAAHGGQLGVDSQPGQGSTFTFTLARGE
jgi:signal transduction histidine kinase